MREILLNRVRLLFVYVYINRKSLYAHRYPKLNRFPCSSERAVSPVNSTSRWYSRLLFHEWESARGLGVEGRNEGSKEGRIGRLVQSSLRGYE